MSSSVKPQTILDDMEDELLVGPNHFSQPREFDLLQDDFLDLAEDPHHAEMAICLASGNNSVAKEVASHHSQATSGAEANLNQFDNPAMKLENLENWEQDVLLSNASLPETNPLLFDEDLDQSVGEDFQKMLNEWEHHIGSIQSNEMPDVDMSNLVSSEVNMSKGPVSASTASAASVTMDTNVIKKEVIEDDPLTSSKPEQLSMVRDEGQTKMTLGQMALAGIVISSGPGDHFETYEVLEATDADNLLEQFEEVASDFDEEQKNPRKTSNIFKAVQNHFAASSNDNNSARRLPRIVPSQRIKDALPREIIERIKASSQKSRTIAIIEPVHKSESDSVSTQQQSSRCTATSNKPSIISKSHVIQPQQHHTRFQEAANSLNKTKHLRLISATSNQQQVQISLDHDYCSSSAKIKRGQQNRLNHHIISSVSSSSTVSRPVIRLQPSGATTSISSSSVTKPSSIVVSSPMTSKSIVRVNPEAVITMPITVEVTSACPVASSPLSSPARKDSGLESGEASDTSESQQTNASNDLFSKVPDYLTAVSVKNSDSRSVGAEEDSKSYDRLPAYVKGVPKRVAEAAAEDSVISKGSNGRLRSAKRSRSTSSNSSAEHSSTEVKTEVVVNNVVSNGRMTTRSRTSTVNNMVASSNGGAGSVRRRRQSSSSSSSSSSDVRSPRQKKRRSWRKPVQPVDRSRSPIGRPRGQQRQVEERRVVYVGRISEGTTRADLRKRFEVFGPIEEISVHFRDRGDNYGFVTFTNKKDAFVAIEHGNDDTSYPKVDLCFGGRRAFCKEKYADLDSGMDGPRQFISAASAGAMMSLSQDNDGDDFDSLLQQARAGLSK